MFGRIHLKKFQRTFSSGVLEATTWAPSAHNAQPWRFVVVEDIAVKRKLAEAMASRWDADMRLDGVPAEKRKMHACRSLGLEVKILPITNDRLKTKIMTDKGTMHFQEYFVRRGAQDKVIDVMFVGAEKTQPAPGVIDSILNADMIVICPGNPIVSLGTIPSVKNVRPMLRETRAKLVAISPIVGDAPIKGPADKLMRGLGLEVSACSVACLYRDFLDGFIIDQSDRTERERIENLELRVIITNTIMKSLRDKVRLAGVTLNQLK